MYIPHSKPYINAASANAIDECLKNGNIAKGSKADTFTDALISFLGTINSLQLTTSGSAALFLALKSIDIQPGDEVIIPTYVCSSVAETILRAGGTPVFCDIEDNWLMMPQNVKKSISSKTKAIVIVHIFGIYAPVEEYRQFGLPLIEDCCQLFAKEVNGKAIGKNADFAFYSFHATKCLTTGEGGAVTCLNNKYQTTFEKVCDEYASLFPLNDMACALGISQLEEYEFLQVRRAAIAETYFSQLPAYSTATLKQITTNLYFRFPLRVKNINFEAVKAKAHNEGVAVRKGVDELLHIKYASGTECPNAEAIFKDTVSIPLYPALTDDEVAKICNVINTILDEN